MTDWCINSTLPAEVLEKIFKVLPRRDLKTAVSKTVRVDVMEKTWLNFLSGEGLQKMEGGGGAAWSLVLGHHHHPPWQLGKVPRILILRFSESLQKESTS